MADEKRRGARNPAPVVVEPKEDQGDDQLTDDQIQRANPTKPLTKKDLQELRKAAEAMTYDESLALAQANGIEFKGVARLDKKQKRALCGLELTINWVEIKPGKLGEYAIVLCCLPTSEKVVFVDGSKGVLEDLKGHIRASVQQGKQPFPLPCPSGLRASDYEKEILAEDGRTVKGMIPATTYYLDLAPHPSTLKALAGRLPAATAN